MTELPTIGQRYRLGDSLVEIVAVGTSYDRRGEPYPVVLVEGDDFGVGAFKIRPELVADLAPACDFDDCAKPVVYTDEWRALCDNHLHNELERQGGACG